MSQLPDLHLTPPPSANQLFVMRGKLRAKSHSYGIWLGVAHIEILDWMHDINNLPVEMRDSMWADSIDIVAPENRRRDLDNYIKPLLDALQRFGVIANDRQLDFIKIHRSAQGEKCVLKLHRTKATSFDASEKSAPKSRRSSAA